MTRQEPGFTIMELMIVVFIIALLAAIAIPKFADLVRRSNEGATKGNLGSIRSAMTVYYGDSQGNYPRRIADLTANGKYLSLVPTAKTPYYHDNSSAENDASSIGDSGGWFFDNGPGDQNYGTVLVDCTHTDSAGNSWNAY
ncbi:MAG TPA: prepilin-type N-terminal cleavage/methylation domain-containing protein [Elusimicrobiota bacterium]|nr:prepilin-type N-terminal cleavage/methylation domain-containing protein [Elusimicrobiota bacterium]